MNRQTRLTCLSKLPCGHWRLLWELWHFMFLVQRKDGSETHTNEQLSFPEAVPFCLQMKHKQHRQKVIRLAKADYSRWFRTPLLLPSRTSKIGAREIHVRKWNHFSVFGPKHESNWAEVLTSDISIYKSCNWVELFAVVRTAAKVWAQAGVYVAALWISARTQVI